MMDRARRLARRIRRTPPKDLVAKGLQVARRTARGVVNARLEAGRSPYAEGTWSLRRYFERLEPEWVQDRREALSDLSERYLQHRFDLLGSGWVQVKHGMIARGIGEAQFQAEPQIQADPEGNWLWARLPQGARPEAVRLWKMIEGEYTPIDWHLDFKSGYRWSESTYYSNVPYGHMAGVDIKVPWELARMQHLPVLGLTFALDQNPDLPREFRNQVLDFMATNPPRFGVNWRCAMDVGIRIVNVLLAWDLFRAAGAEFDQEFERALARSAYEHGLHIRNNLEWSPEHRSNHYFADVAGLLFASLYLESMAEVDEWAALGLRELIGETQYQFNPDGSNFEASTSYHRLSAEMAGWGTALATAAARSGRLKTPVSWPREHVERLYRMGLFTESVTKPNGLIAQIGDNDSGRFVKLAPPLERTPDGPREVMLDHRQLVGLLSGLFNREVYALAPPGGLEERLVRELMKDAQLDPPPRPPFREIVQEADPAQFLSSLNGKEEVYELHVDGGDLLAELELHSYDDFGLYVFRSKRLFLCVRCGPVGQKGNGGHAHLDALSFELSLDGQDLLVDPGTYLYTPDPVQRNLYRSVRAHYAPWIHGMEPGLLDQGLFNLPETQQAKALHFAGNTFLGTHRGYGFAVYRMIKIEPNRLVVRDVSTGLQLERLPELQGGFPKHLPISPAYGIQKPLADS
jgi:hypothetical protein